MGKGGNRYCRIRPPAMEKCTFMLFSSDLACATFVESSKGSRRDDGPPPFTGRQHEAVDSPIQRDASPIVFEPCDEPAVVRGAGATPPARGDFRLGVWIWSDLR